VITVSDDAKKSSKKAVSKRMRPEMTERIAYSVEEFARAIGAAPGTVRKAIRNKEIEVEKIGRRQFIPVSVVKKFTDGDNRN
jgi:excisionase family DNA binding protein